MASRLRLFDCRNSDLPTAAGICRDDVDAVANVVNTVQRRLIYAKEAGDEGWWGSWAEIAFRVDRLFPYFTLGREIARLEMVAVCNRPIPVNNQFYEYLQFGNGRLPSLCQGFTNCNQVVNSRNNSVTFVDLSSPPKILMVVPTDPTDVGKRVLIQGTESNNATIYSEDSGTRITGQFLVLSTPFSTFPFQLNSLTGIQKDLTNGPVQFFQVDPSTGAQVLLLTMEPSELTAWYRRYYFNGLPLGCCVNDTTAQITGIAKLDLIPVRVDSDYCLLQNLEAMIEEAQSMRLSRADTLQAKQMAAEKHHQAIGLLNGELGHYIGRDQVAVQFSPFGSARLERRKIGTLI